MLLIDNDELKVIKCSQQLETLVYWAALLIPDNDFMIADCTETDNSFATYTDYELRILYGNIDESIVPDTIKRDKVLSGLFHLLSNYEEDETPLGELIIRANNENISLDIISGVRGIAECTLAAYPPKEKGRVKRSVEQVNPAKRPKEGTTTALVWATADDLKQSNKESPIDQKEFRKAVMTACEKKGINKATAATQFGKWKKASN